MKCDNGVYLLTGVFMRRLLRILSWPLNSNVQNGIPRLVMVGHIREERGD